MIKKLKRLRFVIFFYSLNKNKNKKRKKERERKNNLSIFLNKIIKKYV